jgi:cytochrome c
MPSIFPEVPEAGGRKLRVSNRVLDVLVAEVVLQSARVKRQRADQLAFLKEATQPGHAPKTAQGGSQMGGMMMGGGGVPNLKKLDPEDRVQSINHCGDTYKVATADGKVRDFWERNLRFKTDVSDEGPQKDAPAIVGAGMMGDRADVIFASPDEISGFIAHQC